MHTHASICYKGNLKWKYCKTNYLEILDVFYVYCYWQSSDVFLATLFALRQLHDLARPVRPPLCSRLKYLNSCWFGCQIKKCCIHSWSSEVESCWHWWPVMFPYNATSSLIFVAHRRNVYMMDWTWIEVIHFMTFLSAKIPNARTRKCEAMMVIGLPASISMLAYVIVDC